MTQGRVLITTVFLHPDSEVDRFLRAAGLETIYRRWDGKRTEDDLIALLQEIDGAIVAGDKFTPRVIQSVDRLKVISRTGVGYDAIDVAAATARGIAVCSTPDVNKYSVADWTMTLLLQCARRTVQNETVLRSGRWDRVEGRELYESTLGIIGLGSIGKEVVRRARGFGMRIVAYDPFPDDAFAAEYGVSYLALEELLRQSDYVSLHTFLNKDTRHLINAERLALMKPTACLVNTSRGGVVDQEALYEALKERRIAWAALDVFEREPLEADSPLRTLDNVYLSAHAAGVTSDARRRSGSTAAENLVRVLRGEKPIHIVNPEVLK
ncbi:MAG TPA: phosphoglycerate dehydrogenase [Chloroflexota bacterium]|nr:phosphoglycerate dehydrogenase [Chloroflexota bacterium]